MVEKYFHKSKISETTIRRELKDIFKKDIVKISKNIKSSFVQVQEWNFEEGQALAKLSFSKKSEEITVILSSPISKFTEKVRRYKLLPDEAKLVWDGSEMWFEWEKEQ